jgi:hypothetical protein
LTGAVGWSAIRVAFSRGDGSFSIGIAVTAADANFAWLAAPTIFSVRDLFELTQAVAVQQLQDAGLAASRSTDTVVTDSLDGGRVVWQRLACSCPRARWCSTRSAGGAEATAERWDRWVHHLRL